MSLKEKLDRFRSDSPSRFTEDQDNVDAMVRRTPREGDFLPPLPPTVGATEPRGTSRRLALVFFRGAW